MPIVLVRYDPEKVSDDEVKWISERLPGLVARHLSVPGTDGELTAADIEVWVNPAGPLDINKKDLTIVIWAGLYPEREKNLDERRQNLLKDIRALLIGVVMSGFFPNNLNRLRNGENII